MKHFLLWLAITSLLATDAATAMAGNVSVSIPMNALRTVSGERGDFYVASIAVPGDVIGKRLDTVVVEFAVDVTPLSVEDSLVTPLVGVYPLTRELSATGGGGSASVDPSAYKGNVPSVRPVANGQTRLLRMDITGIVNGWLRDPLTNHGLVIGSITGPVVGSVLLRDDALDPGIALRVTFYFQDPIADGVSPK